MPSPFPGMDPYLEDPELWPDVHHEMMSVIRRILADQLDPKYAVRIELRIYSVSEDDPATTMIRVPDVKIEQATAGRGGPSAHFGRIPAGLLDADESIEMTTIFADDVKEAFLSVVHVKTRKVVTSIEVISPSNKLPGSQGRKSYLEKRDEILRSSCHLVEIDLLRKGRPIFNRGRLDCDYLIHVSRSERRPKGRVWPIRLSHRLPPIGIPLLDGDPDAFLNMQEVLTTVYDHARYGTSVDYAADPVPPLASRDAAWADALLRRAGLRRRRRRS